jgi:hypothetical protein
VKINPLAVAAAVALVTSVIYFRGMSIDAPVLGAELKAPPQDKTPATEIHRQFFDRIPGQSAATQAKVDDLHSELKQLAASGKGYDFVQAYMRIAECMHFDKTRELVVDDPTQPQASAALPGMRWANEKEVADKVRYCAGMNEMTKRSRLDYLERAASLRATDAAAMLVMEGPFGDPTALITRPEDPLVLEWNRKMRTLLVDNAERGDVSSLIFLKLAHQHGIHPFESSRVLELSYQHVLDAQLGANKRAGGPTAIPTAIGFQPDPALTAAENELAILKATEFINAVRKNRKAR